MFIPIWVIVLLVLIWGLAGLGYRKMGLLMQDLQIQALRYNLDKVNAQEKYTKLYNRFDAYIRHALDRTGHDSDGDRVLTEDGIPILDCNANYTEEYKSTLPQMDTSPRAMGKPE